MEARSKDLGGSVSLLAKDRANDQYGSMRHRSKNERRQAGVS
jgi:hypothetical protein